MLPIGGTARDETIGRYLSSTTTVPDGTLAPPGTHRNPEDPELEKGEEEEQKEEALKEKPPVTKKATVIKKRPLVKEAETLVREGEEETDEKGHDHGTRSWKKGKKAPVGKGGKPSGV